MFEEFFKVSPQLTAVTGSAKKFNSLAMDNFEKLARFQLEAFKGYTDFGLEQMRSALDVSDAATLQTYVISQQKAAQTLGSKLTEDAQTLVELNRQFAADLQKLAQENLQGFSAAAPAKTKKAA